MFFSRNKKHNVYPCKHQFYYMKVGFKGGGQNYIGMFSWWWCLFSHYLFLISSSFGASKRLRFVIVAFPGYLYLFLCAILPRCVHLFPVLYVEQTIVWIALDKRDIKIAYFVYFSVKTYLMARLSKENNNVCFQREIRIKVLEALVGV